MGIPARRGYLASILPQYCLVQRMVNEGLSRGRRGLVFFAGWLDCIQRARVLVVFDITAERDEYYSRHHAPS